MAREVDAIRLHEPLRVVRDVASGEVDAPGFNWRDRGWLRSLSSPGILLEFVWIWLTGRLLPEATPNRRRDWTGRRQPDAKCHVARVPVSGDEGQGLYANHPQLLTRVRNARDPDRPDPAVLAAQKVQGELRTPFWEFPRDWSDGAPGSLGHKWRAAKGMEIGKIPTFFHDARYVRLYRPGRAGSSLLPFPESRYTSRADGKIAYQRCASRLPGNAMHDFLLLQPYQSMRRWRRNRVREIRPVLRGLVGNRMSDIAHTWRSRSRSSMLGMASRRGTEPTAPTSSPTRC